MRVSTDIVAELSGLVKGWVLSSPTLTHRFRQKQFYLALPLLMAPRPIVHSPVYLGMVLPLQFTQNKINVCKDETVLLNRNFNKYFLWTRTLRVVWKRRWITLEFSWSPSPRVRFSILIKHLFTFIGFGSRFVLSRSTPNATLHTYCPKKYAHDCDWSKFSWTLHG